jgi:hypothetical protein
MFGTFHLQGNRKLSKPFINVGVTEQDIGRLLDLELEGAGGLDT